MMKKSVKTIAMAALWALLLALTLTAAPSARAEVLSGTTGPLSWSLNTETGLLTISGTGEMPQYAFYEHEDKYDDVEHYETPWWRNASTITQAQIGEGVTKISANAFDRCVNLASVSLPSTLVEIGSGAFESNALTSVSIPASVTTIGAYAFYKTKLTQLQLPYTVRVVDSYAFARTPITSVSLNHPNTTFGAGVFSGTRVTSVSIGPTMSMVPSGMFSNTPLASVQLPDSIVGIGASAFAGTKLTQIDLPANVSVVGASAFSGALLTRVGLNEGLNEIGASAFAGTGLTEVDLPSTVTDLGDLAFSGAPLTRVGLNEGLKTIGASAFTGTGLTEIDLPGTLRRIGASAFQDLALTELTLPDGLTDIGARAFLGTGLPEVTIPASVQSLPWDAFDPETRLSFETEASGETGGLQWYYMDQVLTLRGSGPMPDYTYSDHPDTPWHSYADIAEVRLSDGITSIGSYAFSGCPYLSVIELPQSLTAIGARAFENCTRLDALTLPSGIASIGSGAFYSCHLSAIDLPASLETIGGSAFYGNDFTAVIIPDGATDIGASAFMMCGQLATFSVPETVTHFGANAFFGCEALKTVTYRTQADMSPIKMWAFHTYDNAYATPTCYGAQFSGGDGMSYFFLYSYDTDISDYAFYNCQSPLRVIVGSGGTGAWRGRVGDYAFYGCSNLVEMNVTEGVGAIGDYAFYGCASLEDIYHLLTAPRIGKYAFYGCGAIGGSSKALSISSAVIGEHAFENCTGVEQVCLANTVRSLGDCAFSGCGDLKLIEFRGHAPSFTQAQSGASGYRQFQGVKAFAVYRLHDSWNASTLLNYGGALTWKLAFDGRLSADGVLRVSGPMVNMQNILRYYQIQSDDSTYTDIIWMDEESVHKLVFEESVTQITGTKPYYNPLGYADEILFLGDMPQIAESSMEYLRGKAYWIESREGWTEAAMTAASATLSWQPVCQAEANLSGITVASHVLNAVEAVEPTCEADGLAAHWICEGCGLTFADADGAARLAEGEEILPATGHSFGEPQFSWSEDHLTCEAVFRCQNPGCEADVSLPAGSAGEPEILREATCAEEGLARYTARVTVGENETGLPVGTFEASAEAVLEKLPHTPVVFPGIPAGCVEPGTTDNILCEVCGETIQESEEVAPLGHLDGISVPAVEPTCAEPGHTAERRCQRCGELLEASRALPALGHDYGAPEIAWSEDGASCAMTFTCVRCAEEAVREAEVSGEIIAQPTCTGNGVTEYTAALSFEGVDYTDTCRRANLPATGHTPVADPAVAPTDREDGLTEGSHCAVCGEVLTPQQVIPALWSFEVGEDGKVTATAYNGDATEVTVPDFITALSASLFRNDETIVSVRVPGSVAEVGSQTFYGMSAAREIVLPDALTGIGALTFYKNDAVLRADMNSATARALSYRGRAFTDGDWTLRYRVTNPDNPPASVALVGFQGDEAELALPGSFGGATLTGIESGAFAGCEQLRALTVPDGVTSIADDAFPGLEGTLTIRSSVNAPARDWAEAHGYAWAHDVHAIIEDAGVEPTCETPGLSAGSHCAECGEIIVPQTPVDALGHDWGETVYEWSEDNTAVTASRVCLRDEAHTQNERVEATSEITRPASCEAAGERTYTSGAFENEAFKVQVKKLTDVPALGHDWGEAVYEWSEDNSTVTASRVCLRDEAHTQSERVEATSEITRPASCEAAGERTYTSGAFENEAFEVQVKTLIDVPALGHAWGEAVYEWSEDNTAVTASRVCLRDEAHTQSEQARTVVERLRMPTEDEPGVVVYMARFEENGFEAQTRRVEDIPALKALKVLRLPAGLTAVGEEAFMGLACEAVIVPEGCASIGARAFADCEALRYIRIPASVAFIAEDAFEGCGGVVVDRKEE